MKMIKPKNLISSITLFTIVGVFLFSGFVSEAAVTTPPPLLIDDYNDPYEGTNFLLLPQYFGKSSSPPAELTLKEPFLHRYNWGLTNKAKEIHYNVTNAGSWGYYSTNLFNEVPPYPIVPPRDVSNYLYLSFRLKREKQTVGPQTVFTGCYLKIRYGNDYASGRETPPVYAPNYFLETDEWQLVNVPLSAFSGLDKTKVQAVIFFFDNTLPVKHGNLYIDNLEFSQGYGKPESTGVVRIDRETRRLYVDDQLFNIKGVGYQPIRIGSTPPFTATTGMCDRDFLHLVEMGCNTIRTWGEPGTTLMSKASEYGLRVIAGFWMDTSRGAPYSDPTYRNTVKQNFTTFVNIYKDLNNSFPPDKQPLLMWALGNENNYNNDPIEPFYTLSNELAQIAYEREGASYHPVMIVNGDLFYIGVRERQSEDLQLNFVDVWGANAYHRDFNSVNWTAIHNNWNWSDAHPDDRGIDWFELYKEKSFKPLVITEYGSDAYYTTGLNPITGYEDEDMQADFVRSNTLDITDASDVCLGGTLMAYSDEWWKDSSAGASRSIHDLGPAYFWDDRLQDSYVNEEWWGIMKIAPDGTWSEPDGLDDMKRRKVFNTLKLIFNGAKVVEPGGSIQAAIDSSASGDTIYVVDGEFVEDNISISNKDDITLVGDGNEDTTIKSNILSKDSDISLENLSIVYKKGGGFPYSTDMEFTNDAGVTAINSEITVRNCIIMPDPAIFGENKYGKGIQIWNLYGTGDIKPIIENNLILNCEAGVYLYSHDLGGAILGEIKNNTLDLNNYGIVLRMHKENPAIHHNIMTRSHDAIHYTYSSILVERERNITYNCFGEGLFDNVNDIWCDAVQNDLNKIRIFPYRGAPFGWWNPFANLGNVDADPEFIQPYEYPDYIYPEDLDYTPQNPACSDKGSRF